MNSKGNGSGGSAEYGAGEVPVPESDDEPFEVRWQRPPDVFSVSRSAVNTVLAELGLAGLGVYIVLCRDMGYRAMQTEEMIALAANRLCMDEAFVGGIIDRFLELGVIE